MRRLIRHFLALLLLTAAPAVAQPGIGTCVMGETRSSTFGQGGLYGLGFTIYQWFEPGNCGFCLVSDGAIQLKTVELEVFNNVSVPWSIDATVSVIGWKGSADCPQPDESVVLLPPQSITFVVPPFNPFVSTVRSPIIDSPAFLQPAFLRLEFKPVAGTPVNVAVGQIAGPCTSCRQYITSQFLRTVRSDACLGLGNYPWVVRARGDCVAVTGTRPVTWGRLKAFYR